MKYFMIRLLVCSLLIVQFSGCSKDFLGTEEKTLPVAPLPVMTDYLKYNYSFSMLYGALQKAGLTDLLSDREKQFTLLAPDNAAFAKAGITQDSINKMSPAYLKEWLSYHLLPGKMVYDGIPAILNGIHTTINNKTVYISKQPAVGGGAAVNAVEMATYQVKDIPVYNGIVYVLKTPLTLPAASIKQILTTNPEYSRFGQALASFGLLDKLEGPGPFVVLAVKNNLFISEGEMASIDTFTYKKYLFDAYIMKDRFFFHTDFQYRPAPEDPNALRYYIGSEGTLVIDNYATFWAMPLSAAPDVDYWSWGLGDMVSLEFPPSNSLLANNGVVIDCTGLLVYPYNMMK